MVTRRLVGLILILVLACVAVPIGQHFLALSLHHFDFTISWGNFALIVPTLGVLIALLLERSGAHKLD